MKKNYKTKLYKIAIATVWVFHKNGAYTKKEKQKAL